MTEFSNLGMLITILIIYKALETAGSVSSCKQQSLEWHNHFRKIHQVGNVTWSRNLWEKASSWADNLAKNNLFRHDPKDPGNIFLSHGKPTDACSRAVKLFYAEEKNYNYKKPQYYPNAGHFTQLVWKNTKQIGAASRIRNDGKTVVVFKYFPPGNVDGYFSENVFPPRKPFVTTGPSIVTHPNVTSNATSTHTKPNLYVRGEASSVKVWKEIQLALQGLIVGFLTN